MAAPKGLQDQAARLLAVALQARERGDIELAEELTARAMQYLDEAAQAESHDATGGTSGTPPAPNPTQPAVQQQQQIQPDPDEDKTTK
jgi:hypothetical protein